jgi:hypothetical protein
MLYLDFLRRLHELLEPPTYLEIGIRHGDSLALARGTSVGIDPSYELRTEIGPATTLFRETSDDYFDRDDAFAPFGGRPISLAFIDGLHLLEFALRDFINVERGADWSSVVVFDDILPLHAEEATRKRRTRLWTGDVYKILQVFARHRPDLVCLRVATEPTGLLLVLGLDPGSTVLDDRYDEIVLETISPDPQEVPAAVLEREGVLEPGALLSSSLWPALRQARDGGVGRRAGLARLRRALRKEFGRPLTRGRRLPVRA